MKAFKIEKILIPIDFSETAFIAIEHAAYIAQTFKAELVLLHVVERHWEQFNIIQPELIVPNPSEITQLIEKKLEQVASDVYAKYGVKSTSITSDGSIFSEIISVADDQDVDLIVMGTHGTKGFVEFFVGSNTYKVVTQSFCPVLSVQKHAEKVGFKNIVLPIDDSLHSRQKVSHAVTIAKVFGSTIHIVGLHESGEDKKFVFKIEQIVEYIKKSGLQSTSKIFKDTNQARITQEYAKAINADLMIIMTDQDENITGRLLGSFAQQIVNHSAIPVISIPPELGIIEYPSLGGGYHGA